MSLKDCLRIVKTLDPADRDSFNTEFERLVKGGIPPEEAYMEAAEHVMQVILIDRNAVAGDINEAGGYLEILTLENLVNPASYEQAPRGVAADIAKMSAEEFDSLLDEVAPAPKKPVSAPKEPPPRKVTGEESAARFIATKRGTRKGLNSVSAKELKQVAKSAGISGYSNKDKAGVIKMLETWHDAHLVGLLPEPYPGPQAAAALRAAIYNRADSSMGVVVNSEDPAIGAWAEHYGASVQKKADTYEGNKTDKGYHFQGLTAFDRFLADYAGRQLREYEGDMMTGGELTHVPYEEVKQEQLTLERGDLVEIVPDMPGDPAIPGEVMGSVSHAEATTEGIKSTLESYVVRYEDPDTGETRNEGFHPSFLRKRKPPGKKARAALEAAAKHGVAGADEALTGLAELFGGKSKFSSGFTFDEETYAKAKPHFKKSLEEFVSAGKSLKEFLQFILENFGEGIKPYLRRFHQDVADDKITIRGVNDVQLATPDQAQPGEPRAEPADSVDIEDAGAEAAGVPGETGVGPAEEEAVAPGSIGLPVDSSLDVGKQGDINLLGDTGEFQPAAGVTGHQDGRRGTVAGAEGISADTPGSTQAEAAARSTRDRLNLRPTTDTWVQGDSQNIIESLPVLFPEQHDDVGFAEKRLFDEGHRGAMFTNGTGTGKTFTGLGLAKRFVMQGKDNILITVPGEKIAADWIKSGRALDLGITKLKTTKDAGQGVVITTYANLSENDELAKRDWDLVIHDEAHKLSENMAGNATNALNKSRAITGHPDGHWTYAASMERELLDKMQGLRDQIEHFASEAELNPEQRGMFIEASNKLSDELDELNIVWRERLAEHTENRKGLWNAKTTKRLDLTATPFAYMKSTDHAEGFLFEYDREAAEQNTGYNAPDARGAFMVEHFGYRMRYGKLTEPEADVDTGLMQREFNQWLKAQGALRGRVLTVDHDYSREFIAIDDLVGKKIDDGWDMIRQRSMDKDNPNQKGYELMEKALRKQFNYHARVRMLEAIKARFAVQRAKQHMALGRKVVLFHSRIQGGTMNPFHIFAGAAAAAELDVVASDEEAAMYQAAANEFVHEREDLMRLDINTVRPLDLFAEEFGDNMTVYNGTITNKAKRENPDRFNSDGEEIQVIAVQDEGGKEGISLHDATGANQRVLINLGLPVRPTQAIQIEGRIYRVGQMSNAIFEYFNTGTNFERMTFAEKISERASTAENLAMGEQARTLKDSFIDAYEDPSFEDPSEAQGRGGKEVDRANWAATSEFERAKTHYFGTLKTKGKRDQRAGMDYFATPEPLGVKMVEWSGIHPNESVLEPSAGHGAIGRYFPDNADATFVEPSSELLSRLALRAPGKHRQMRFEDLDVGGNKYHAIVMNPPFGTGGSTAIQHVHKAMHHLKNGGRIVALIPEGPAADKKFQNMFYGKDGELEQLKAAVKKKRKEGGSIATETRRIDDLTNFHLRASISLPAITFKRAGTGVRSRIVVIDKITNSKASIVSQSPRDIFADTINELFDKIEGMTVPPRTELEQSPEEYLAREGLTVTYNEADENWLITGRTFEHKAVIRRALGDDVEFARGWMSKIDPVDALYGEMTAPQVAREAVTQPTQADITAAAAAIISGRAAPAPDALGGLVVTETKTKTDKQVWEVSGNTRDHKDMLKRLGARWYGPKKVWTFWDSDPTDAIASELRKPLALRDRRGGSTKARVKQYLAAPIKRLSSRVPIEIVQSVDQIKTTFDLPADARGFYIDGKAYVVADNIRDKHDAEIALTHEVVGHLGLEGVLGRRKTNELVGDIVNMKVEEMLAPGTHPQLAKILRTLREVYVDEAGNYTLNPKDEALEVIAHIAESRPRIGPLIEIYNKIMLWFRQQLGRWGFTDLTMLEIEEALIRSVDFVKAPPSYYTGEAPDGSTSMRVYRISDGEPIAVEQPVEERVVGQVNFGFGRYFGSLQEASAFFATDEAVSAPTPQELLDWKGAYGMQMPVSQQAFMQLLEQPSTYFEGSGMTGGQVYRTAASEVKQGSELGERIKNIARTSGQDVDAMSPDQTVSLALRQLGVRGVRYPGKPGYKYVIFTGEDVKPRAPLASRKPYRSEPKPGEDPAEFERYKKLGLQGKKTLWQKINNLRLKVIVETMDSMTARGYEGLFDGLIALKEYEIKAGVGIGIGDYENSAYVSARLATGVADMMTHILHYGPLRWYKGVGSHAGEWTDAAGNQKRFRGLLEVLEELGPEQINDWLMWMGANRARQLMAEGRERNLSETDIAAGLAKAEGREELFTRIKDEYAAMNKAQLDFAQEAGLIDTVKRAEWESEWYIPFYRLSEDEIEAPRLKRGLSHQEAGIRRLFGAEIPTADLLENVITNWLKLTDASVKNHALRLMVDNFKGKELDSGQEFITSETMRFTKVLVPRSEIRKRLMQDRSFAMQVARFLGMEETANNLEIINEVNKIPAQGFEQLWAITAPKDKDIVRVKRNGKNEYWRINIPGVLRATGHMTARDWQGSAGMRAGRWFKRLLTTGVTLSPDFMLRNFIRDAAHAWAINPDNMFFAVDSFKGLKKALDEDTIYQSMMAAGASFQGGYVHGTDPEASTQIIRRHLEKKGLTDAAIHAHLGSIVNTPEKLKSTVLELWQNYREIGDKVENANRIATMQKALDAGKPLAQALFESKDLMDYSRRGNLGLLIFMTDLLPFLNARMQGLDKLGRATGQHKKIVAMKAGKIIAFSVVLAMLNDDDERYKELPDWEKDAYWHIFPFDRHIRIPKPFELGIFAGTIPERMYRTWVTQSQPSEKLLWSLRHNLMETLNINYGIPQFMLPLLEVGLNRSMYFDQPIESLSDRANLLPKERHNAFTSNTAMELGDTALAEWLRLSPKQIQHIWNGYTGTMGAYALKLSDMLVRGASAEHPSREAIMPHDVPIIRAIYQGQRVKGTQWATDFYDRMKEVRELHGTMKKYVEQGKLDKARAFRGKHKEKLKHRRQMEGAQKIFSRLRTKRDKIMRSTELTAQQKYQQMQAVQMRINVLAKKIEGQTRSAFAE